MPDDAAVLGTPSQLDLPVEGMSCASCVRRVERALARVDGVASASANFVTGQVSIALRPGADPSGLRPVLAEAVARAGYSLPAPASTRGGPSVAEQGSRDWLRPFCAGMLAAPFLLGMVGMGFGRDWMPPTWVQAALATAAQVGIGAPVYRRALGAVRAGSGSMDVLVALGTTAAWALSWFLLLEGSHHLYFEASTVVLAFVALGRFLEDRARAATGAAVDALLRLRPDVARRLEPDGAERDVPTAELRAGDRVAVRPGGRVPADGVVESGEAGVDESALTGESRPSSRGPGAALAAGTVVLDGRLVLRVTTTGSGTRLARIASLVEAAQGSRAPVQRLADRVSAAFVPGVLLLSALTLAGWLTAGAGMAPAVLAAVAVLVVACPCALGLATPAAIVAGTGAAARAGILLRDAGAIEQARRIDLVAFDKTGTLTQGRPRLVALHAAPGVDRAEALRLAARLQAGSEHPLARAVLAEARGEDEILVAAENFRALPGRGVEGSVGGRHLRLGSDRLLGRASVPETLAAAAEAEAALGRSQSWLLEGERVLALLCFADAPLAGAAAAVAALRRRGFRVAMLSGDGEAAARDAARALGITEVAHRLLPEDKVARLAGWQSEGRRVAMVGDGVNDAPALASADLGIAVGGSTDIAVAAAHVTLLRSDPALVLATLDVARATWRAIVQNLAWAFAFNLVAIPAAALGHLSPALAGGAMACSSLAVLGNALRLSRWRPGA